MEKLEGIEPSAQDSTEQNPFRKRLIRKLAEVVIPYCVEGVLLETPFDYPPDFNDRVRDLMHGGRYWPVILGTHKSHPAGIPLIELSNHLAKICNPFLADDEQIKGSLLVLAKTMEGKQGEEMANAFRMAKPVIDKNNTQILPIIRKKDEEYFSDEEISEVGSESRIAIGNAVSAGQIPLLLPEGVVESGRQKPGGAPGEINGMVAPEPRAISNLLTRLQRGGKKEPLLFFVGTTGENRIYDPITKKITTEAYVTAATRTIPLIGKHLKEPIMRSVVDYPITLTQLREIYGDNGRLSPEELDRVCGNLLARLLPQNERGIFTENEFRHFDEPAGRREAEDLY